MPNRHRFFLVYNQRAGTARDRAVHALIAALQGAGASVHVAPPGPMTEVREAAASAARSGRFDALIACGGDGTIRQVAMAAAGTTCPVGPCMLGTGNVLAHELNLPRDIEALAQMFQRAPDIPVAMARANDEPFLLMAGAGFDGRVIQHLDHRLKQRVAKLAYVPATLKAMGAPADALDVSIDGETAEQAQWVIVSSASRYGGGFRLTTRTRVNAPGLVAILFRGRRRFDLVRYNLAIALGRLDQIADRRQDVDIRPARTITVNSRVPVPVQIDGDDFGATPLTVHDDGPVVRVIAPA